MARKVLVPQYRIIIRVYAKQKSGFIQQSWLESVIGFRHDLHLGLINDVIVVI